MASNSSYPDPDAQMGGGPGLYGNQNGGTPPPQQQHNIPTDPELQLQEGIAQLQRSSDMMHAGAAHAQQMNPMSAAHHSFHTPPRPTHSPQQMAQTVMSMEEHAMYGDDSASRKRSKVSRACDECRRKKIRCDATSENGPEACSSCKRTGARCQFSRQPMKRGPSKGYIKELADRLNSLENQIQNPHAASQGFDFTGVSDPALPDLHTPSQLQRKRTHSMSEGFQDTFARHGWSGQDRGIATRDSQMWSMLTHQDFPTNGQTMRRPSLSDITLAGSLITGSNEETLKAYYGSIHPVLPVLSHETPSLNRLTNCPAKLRETFFVALECSIRSFSPTALPPGGASVGQLVQQCSELLDQTQHALSDTNSSRQFYNNIVYCQALVFVIIASDRPGPSASGNTAEYLGRLAGRVSDIGLNDSKTLATLREQDHESFDDARRLFWVSFILDRFYASSRSKDAALPLQCGTVSRDDFNALGEAGYHLARAADIVGQIAYVTRAGNVPNLDASSPFAFSAMTSTTPTFLYLNGQLSRFRESLDISTLTPNSPPQLAYQYLRILVARLSVFTASKEILSLTKELLDNVRGSPITPLHHIFASLAATSLTELSDRVETQVEAHTAIKEMDDAIANGQIIYRIPNGSGWDAAIRNILHQTKAPSPNTTSERTSPAVQPVQPNMAGLQHLAAAAVGERDSADARPSSSAGNQDLKHDVTAAMAAASEAAAAQATAAAAQKQMQSSSGSNGGNSYDPSALVKDGFMSALT